MYFDKLIIELLKSTKYYEHDQPDRDAKIAFLGDTTLV